MKIYRIVLSNDYEYIHNFQSVLDNENALRNIKQQLIEYIEDLVEDEEYYANNLKNSDEFEDDYRRLVYERVLVRINSLNKIITHIQNIEKIEYINLLKIPNNGEVDIIKDYILT